MQEKRSVYGENHPPEEGGNERGIREQTADAEKERSTAEQLDDAREQRAEDQPATGGMGREGTPKDGPSQGRPQAISEEDE